MGQNAVTKFSVPELRRVFDSFEGDKSPQENTNKLASLQTIYAIIHEHFAEKAGNRGIIHELAEDEGEVLFKKESKNAGGNVLGGSFLNQSQVDVKGG